MKPNAQELWNSFREILRDSSFFPSAPPQKTVDETILIIKALAMDIAPEDLRIIDQQLLEKKKAFLTPRYLELLAEMRRNAGLQDLSLEALRLREIDRAAILKPVEFMSFPHPEVRLALLTRFGPASSSGCLRDIYDLDPDIEVKTEVVHTINRRLARAEIHDLPEERRRLIAFAEEVVAAGFYHGINIEPAKAALALLRGRHEGILPEPIRGIKTAYWPHSSFDGLTTQERTGVARFYGAFMTAPELLAHIARETDHELTTVLLEHLEGNWELGVDPEGSDTPVAREIFLKQVADTLLYKLGFEELPAGLRDDLLRGESPESELPVQAILKRLAIRALDDIGKE